MRKLVLAAVMMLVAVSASAQTSVKGTYACEGKLADSAPYSAVLTIDQDKHTVYLEWRLGGGNGEFYGLGLVQDNRLSSSFGDVRGGPAAVIVYEIKDKGKTLKGEYMSGKGQSRPETCKKITDEILPLPSPAPISPEPSTNTNPNQRL